MTKSSRIRWAGQAASLGDLRNEYKILVVKNEGMRPDGYLGQLWEDDIKIDLKEIGYGGIEWIKLVQGMIRCHARVQCNVSSGSVNLGKLWRAQFPSFSREGLCSTEVV
jgi:hypothetical protein